MVAPAVQALWQQLGVFAGGPLLRLVGRDVACLHLLFAIALYRPRLPLAELSFDHRSQGHVWHANRLVRPLTGAPAQTSAFMPQGDGRITAAARQGLRRGIAPRIAR